jgi:hypothetical protein
LKVTAEVPERDVGQVVDGQRATITTEAHLGEVFAAEVVRIGAAVGRKALRTEDPRDRLDQKVVEVELAVQPDPRLRSAMTVDVVLAPTVATAAPRGRAAICARDYWAARAPAHPLPAVSTQALARNFLREPGTVNRQTLAEPAPTTAADSSGSMVVVRSFTLSVPPVRMISIVTSAGALPRFFTSHRIPLAPPTIGGVWSTTAAACDAKARLPTHAAIVLMLRFFMRTSVRRSTSKRPPRNVWALLGTERFVHRRDDPGHLDARLRQVDAERPSAHAPNEGVAAAARERS